MYQISKQLCAIVNHATLRGWVVGYIGPLSLQLSLYRRGRFFHVWLLLKTGKREAK